MDKRFIALDVNLYEDTLTVIFPNRLNLENNNLLFFFKKRKEHKEYYVDFDFRPYSDDQSIVTFQLGQLKGYFEEKARLDLYACYKDDRENQYYRIYTNIYYNEKRKRYFDLIPFSNDLYLSPYITKNKQLSVLINTKQKIEEEKFEGYASLRRITFKKSELNLKIKVCTSDDIVYNALILKHRKGTEVVRVDCKSNNVQGEIVKFRIDLSEIQFQQFYWDLYLEICTSTGSLIHLRVGNYSLWNKFKLQYLYIIKDCVDEKGYLILPYITAGEEISISYRKKGPYEAKKYKLNECIAYILYILFGLFYMKSKIWLIHEKYSETAQDNSFSFFKYCYHNQPQKKVYFVIKKESKDYQHTKLYQNRVVHFMSIKHLFLILVSNRIVSSESKGHGFAWRVSHGLIKPHLNQKRFIFLQHGVLGLKKIDNTFKANGFNHADLFVASSDFEKKIINEYLGYSLKNIKVTGLARWDELERRNLLGKEILCLPTWRNWLEEVEKEEFLQSDYYRQYYQLITSPELKGYLKQNNIILNFYLHPKFIQFAELFMDNQGEHIKIIEFGQETISSLIRKTDLLITDYSSVAWEYYYLDKPVLFFQFDRGKYETLQGSYMNLETDLFGKSTTSVNGLINLLDGAIGSTAKTSIDGYKSKSKYFKYVDRNNCKRIFQYILLNEAQYGLKEKALYKLKRNPMIRTLWKKLNIKFR